MADRERIAFFLPSLRGGGVEKNFLRLAGAFAEGGHPVDIVLTRAGGDYENVVPAGVRLHVLRPSGILRSRLLAARVSGIPLPTLLRPVLLPWKSSRILRHIAGLTDYLDRNRPRVLIAGMPYPNLVAVWAGNRAQVRPRIIVTERNTLSQTIRHVRRKWRWRYLPAVMRHSYPQADHIVAVSDGVADNLATTTGLPRRYIQTIYNPVASPAIVKQAKPRPGHPWFVPDSPPVIVGLGRLVPAKRFDLLIRAFARLRGQRDAHLLILGEGRERNALTTIAQGLDIVQDVDMPGFMDNPYQYLAHCDLFVLSSDYEGLPTALIEALACGARIVSTDCPSGPQEILAGGVHGELTPCGDEAALAAAMQRALTRPADPDSQKRRAQYFSLQESMRRYVELCFDR